MFYVLYSFNQNSGFILYNSLIYKKAIDFYLYLCYNLYRRQGDVLVAQLDRVTGYEPVGRGFESLQARHSVS